MAENKDPAFLFYSGDFLVGTMGMSMEDRGKYITLMAYQHQNGHISLETIRLLLGNDWVNENDILKSKFEIDDLGLLFNSRVDEEIEKRAKFTLSRRENGKKGGRPKKENKPSAKPNGKARHKPRNNHSGDVNEDVINMFKSFNNNEDLQNNLIDFYKMRLDIKPMTNAAVTRLLNKLTKIAADENEMIQMLDNSIINGWQDVYELKERKETKNAKSESDIYEDWNVKRI